jgi:hypothetical protein
MSSLKPISLIGGKPIRAQVVGEYGMAEEKTQSEFVQHMKAAASSAGKQWKSLIPKEFWQHGREAKREMLLAFRTVVDGAIDRLEASEERAAARREAPRKAKIEVE